MKIETYKEMINRANTFLKAVENDELYFSNHVSYDFTRYIHITNIEDIDANDINKIKCSFERLEVASNHNASGYSYSYSNMYSDTLDLSTLTPITRNVFNKEMENFKRNI